MIRFYCSAILVLCLATMVLVLLTPTVVFFTILYAVGYPSWFVMRTLTSSDTPRVPRDRQIEHLQTLFADGVIDLGELELYLECLLVHEQLLPSSELPRYERRQRSVLDMLEL